MERRVGVDLDGRGGHIGKGSSGLGVGAGDLLDEDRATHSTPPGGVERVLDSDVVIGDDRRDLDLAADELSRELEVEDVAGVVLDDVQDAGPAIDGAGRGFHLVGYGRGEDVTCSGRIEHAQTDEPAMERFVAGAATGHEGDLAGFRATGPQHQQVGLSRSSGCRRGHDRGRPGSPVRGRPRR